MSHMSYDKNMIEHYHTEIKKNKKIFGKFRALINFTVDSSYLSFKMSGCQNSLSQMLRTYTGVGGDPGGSKKG